MITKSIKLFVAHYKSIPSFFKIKTGSAIKSVNYGLGTEDTPIFPNMHEASALLVGGTLTAVDAVMTGQSLHALNLGGGLHHGFRLSTIAASTPGIGFPIEPGLISRQG